MKIKRWHIALGILISAVFFTWHFAKLNLISSGNTCAARGGRGCCWGWFLLYGCLIRTWRWQVLLNPLKRIPQRQLFPVVCIGYMGNNVYPARAGEVLRSVLLKQTDDVPISGSRQRSLSSVCSTASPSWLWCC